MTPNVPEVLAMGVQWYIDALAMSAHKAQAERKHLEWEAMNRWFDEDPHLATDMLALGRSFQGVKLRSNAVYDWVRSR